MNGKRCWKNRDGDLIPFDQIDDDYLFNILNLIARRCDFFRTSPGFERSRQFKLLAEEASNRGYDPSVFVERVERWQTTRNNTTADKNTTFGKRP